MALLAPQPVGNTINLQGLKALVKQQRGRVAVAGWVAITGRFNIDLRSVNDRWLSVEGLFDDFTNGHAGDYAAVEFGGQQKAQATLQRVVV